MHSVLVYHSISKPTKPLPGDIDISPRRFEQQLRWLSRWRQVVRLYQTLRSNENRLVALTFDDGFRDNLTVALPLLEKFNMPMTLFVTAGFIGKEGYLSADELRQMARHPLVTIGAHGLTHAHFNELTHQQAQFELLESRRALEQITGKTVDLLAWPYGECSEFLEQLSEDCGYRASWTVWKGSNKKVSGAYFPTKHLENKLASLRRSY
jgi:peptidoglycan/xylan/chitin deacetylase (PgdA/CDA1 family)